MNGNTQDETDTKETKVKTERSSAESCNIAINGVFTNSQQVYDHSEMFSYMQQKVNGTMISSVEYMTYF